MEGQRKGGVKAMAHSAENPTGGPATIGRPPTSGLAPPRTTGTSHRLPGIMTARNARQNRRKGRRIEGKIYEEESEDAETSVICVAKRIKMNFVKDTNLRAPLGYRELPPGAMYPLSRRNFRMPPIKHLRR